MPKLPRYAHIGAPKAASKALQNHLFNAHPQLGHVGLGVGGPVGWATPELCRRLETDLRCMKPLLYDPKPVSAAWSAALDSVRTPQTKRVGLSYENLTITLPLDVDVTEKARRMKALLGETTKVVYVVREQRDLLRSGYAELLLNGLAVDFQTFIDNQLRAHVRSWISDLRYGAQLDLWQRTFGSENLLVVFQEELVSQPAQELNRIQRFLDVQPTVHTLPREHEGLSPLQLAVLLHMNQRMRHDFSDAHSSLIQGDRLAAPLDATWPELPPLDRLSNAVLGRAAARAARAIDHLPGVPPLERTYRPDQQQMLGRLYAEDNAMLSARLGRALPDGYITND